MPQAIISALPQGTVLQGKSYSYTIEKALGQGTFGITYLAKAKTQGDHGNIDCSFYVAIKEFFMKDINGREDTLVASGSNGGLFADYRKKFAREAQNLGKLNHPNIIRVFESFEANNTSYYSMEYIDGGSLDDYITEHQGIPEQKAIDITKQIGNAISFMHRNKMLHLDLKPANIMLRTDGTVVLIDFGLSKQYTSNGEPESSTTVGRGTPGYAPLEQANYQDGHGFPVTMDVYALGATMYKMLVGHRPDEASTILNEGFPVDGLQNCGASRSTVDVIKKAMSPLRKDRFQRADDLLEALTDRPELPKKEGWTAKRVLKVVLLTLFILYGIGAVGTRILTFFKPAPTVQPSKTCITCGKPRIICPFKGVHPKDVASSPVSNLQLNVEALNNASQPEESKTTPQAEEPKPTTGSINGHDWVDLGLPSGLKWATCNVGAKRPGDYGGFYAWGETKTKEVYDWDTCFDCLDPDNWQDDNSWGVYKKGGKLQITPNSGHDVARKNWGSTWRMPTIKELEELNNKCKWKWATQDGHNGYIVTGPNGNSIFLPAAGCSFGDDPEPIGVGEDGDYRSSTCSPTFSNDARILAIGKDEHYTTSFNRCAGSSVRPVTE